MGRLIDADVLMETLERGDWVHITDYNIAIYAVKDAPTVDAVPGVRCADCIRFRPDDDVWGWCTVSGKMRCKDYCSYGVRKDGGDE